MHDYNPKAIHGMAALLNTVAFITTAVFVVAGLLTSLIVFSFLANALGGADSSVFALLAAVVYFTVIAGIGYLIALILRVIAQLMLAVVKIELNTRAGLDAESAAAVEHEVSQIRVPDLAHGAMVCPKCGDEYVEGHDTCAECGVNLVPRNVAQ